VIPSVVFAGWKLYTLLDAFCNPPASAPKSRWMIPEDKQSDIVETEPTIEIEMVDTRSTRLNNYSHTALSSAITSRAVPDDSKDSAATAAAEAVAVFRY
jgi:hypothetical protein